MTHWGYDARPYFPQYWISCKGMIGMDEDGKPLFPVAQEREEITCPKCLKDFIDTDLCLKGKVAKEDLSQKLMDDRASMNGPIRRDTE